MGYYDVYHRAVVVSTRRLTPHLLRIELGGEGLRGWSSSGVPDERLVLVLPAPGASAVAEPTTMPDGTQDYPDPDDQPPMRSYTVRAWDAEALRMTVDFVVHEGGVASTWAQAAAPGDVIYLTEAMGWYRPPAGTAWQLLVADLTGLPALARAVEALPAGAQAYAVVEVPGPDDRIEVESAADVRWTWLVGCGNDAGPSLLPEAVERFEAPEGPGYVWFAGEASASRAVRKHLRQVRGWPTARACTLGYWRVDSERWDARYAEVAPTLESVYTEAVAAGVSSDEALELYDEALERAGL
ncbi:siderophore-interacting protein [Microlunatus flavus]|uniref:NADPH-dependent ferric siderophore reductase, contains FAD-binding and SIP domains n=1 Tax=Microlunatus flavus TaxID=1036181 RepID=A0A1H9BYR7_9ACTN|nr:siderophore-interacting protein [Microlunatus flavus]SEP93907.1 NADPH-dependent ferric siderophore reductase, contains FAD-binding and SIP domains [Microlunatus flavus]